TCGLIYLPYIISARQKLLGSFILVLKLSLGRFIGYVIFGALAGYLGRIMPYTFRNMLIHSIYIIMGIFLVASAFRGNKEENCNTRKWLKFTNSSILLGFFTGINLCPPFILAFSRAMELGGVASGILLFLGFFCGTILYIIPLGFAGFASRLKMLRNIARGVAIIVGLWFFIQGVSGLILISRTPQTPEDGQEVVNILEEDQIYLVGSTGILDDCLHNALKLYFRGIIVSLDPSAVNTVPIKSTVLLMPKSIMGLPSFDTVIKQCSRKSCKIIILPSGLTDIPLDNPEKLEEICKNIALFLHSYYFMVETEKGLTWRFPENF
ncbi:sulfite exporter TauE/SafE family protein, partial [bacterium]|nr:sulfite exporter TauE/SafE family protein [bacterium]